MDHLKLFVFALFLGSDVASLVGQPEIFNIWQRLDSGGKHEKFEIDLSVKGISQSI